LVHHIDAARYSRVVPEDKARHQEWDHGDVAAYHHAREPYRVAAWSGGHTHARNLFRWDGTPDTKHKEHGIPFLNTDNTRHFGRLAQAFLPIEASMRLLRLPEFATKDGWQAATGHPQSGISSSPAEVQSHPGSTGCHCPQLSSQAARRRGQLDPALIDSDLPQRDGRHREAFAFSHQIARGVHPLVGDQFPGHRIRELGGYAGTLPAIDHPGALGIEHHQTHDQRFRPVRYNRLGSLDPGRTVGFADHEPNLQPQHSSRQGPERIVIEIVGAQLR
jgi:hypothetical protein